MFLFLKIQNAQLMSHVLIFYFCYYGFSWIPEMNEIKEQ